MSDSERPQDEPQVPQRTISVDGSANVKLPRSDSADATLPRSIGRYRILGKLGEGGMGVVYEAEQQEPRRRVALKVVRGGQFVDDVRVRMFQREAETLARLRHPNIGGIYESGRTDDGQYFFAMELVVGPTLNEYLRSRPRIDQAGELRFRLGLFRKIVHAVHYAHQRGVIHRDLKPSNVIVAAEAAPVADDSTASESITGLALPDPKILDFGLARITEGDVQATQVTEIGVIKGTLAYMSPEQARGNPHDIDLRTDVYSLGVMLYEMIAGQLPYDVNRGSLPEAVRVICETGAQPLATATRMRLDPDVVTIAGKALEKAADRRYSSAAALHEDIGRYLTSQPITARPPSTIYQVRKFAARNRAMVAGVLATFVVLVAGVIVSSVLGLREASQRRAAQQAREALEVVAEFQQRMLEQVDVPRMGTRLFADLGLRLDQALVAEGWDDGERAAMVSGLDDRLRRLNSTDVALQTLDRSVLERAEETIDAELRNQPKVYARLNQTLGTTCFELGLYERAETLLRRAIAAYEGPAEGEAEAATVRRTLGTVFVYQGRFEEAAPELEAALEAHRRLLGEDHAESLDDLSAIALLHRENLELEPAEALYTDLVERRTRIDGPEAESTLSARDGLAWIYLEQKRHDEAEAIQLEVLEQARRSFGAESEIYLATLNNLAVNYVQQGRYDESEPLYLEELEHARRRFGTEHRETHISITNLGRLYLRTERFEDAERLLGEAVQVGRRVVGAGEFGMGIAVDSYGKSLLGLGRHDEAEAPLLEAWEIFVPILGEDHRGSRGVAGSLADVYRKKGNQTEAARWAARADSGD